MALKQFYQDNVLNQFDSYTYKWKIMMCHPMEAHRFEQLISDDNNRVVVLAESGVESEINIGSVQHSLTLALKKNQDRNGVANMFSFNLIEPGGATFFNRILEAARRLTIENHLKAAYLLELRFIGTKDGITTENVVGPFYYVTTTTGITFDYADGATTYRMDMVETKVDAFKPQTLYLKQDTGTLKATTFGEFLDVFTKEVNEQERERVNLTNAQIFADEYTFNTRNEATEWNGWTFGASGAAGDTRLKGTSVTGAGGTLTFNFAKGTALSDCVVVALLHTVNMRKLPTGAGGFHKDNPDEGEAKAQTFKDLSSWFVFDTQTEYGHYDTRTKRYQLKIEYSLIKYLNGDVIHDPNSYDQMLKSSNIQKDRIKNLFKQGLIRKRFDYSFTGLNTEVLNLDISLQNTYFQLQALNHGKLATRSQAFTGMGTEGESFNRIQGSLDDNNSERQALKAKDAKLKSQLEASSGGDPEIDSIATNQTAIKTAIAENNEALKKNAEQGKILRDERNSAYEKLPSAKARLEGSLSLSNRYITQDQLLGNVANPSDSQETTPLTFEANVVNSKATQGPDNENQGAVMLGAVELNLNTLGDLTNQLLSIRGDPYWLGRPKGSKTKFEGANYDVGGTNYFLNLNFPTYPDESTGLMSVAEQNFGIIGLYRVFNVEASYSDGQFTMQLQSFRDLNTNIGLTIDELLSGEIDDSDYRAQEQRYMGIDGPADAELLDQQDSGNNVTGPELGIVQDGDASGTVNEKQSSVAGIRTQAITQELKGILQNAASETGLDVEVYSGGQPAIGTSNKRTGSTRHDNGRAADVNLFTGTGANRRKLSLKNPADVPMIQNYLQTAKKYGATGFGAGNGYMGDDGFHIDNVPNRGGVWGGPFDPVRKTYTRDGAPAWLRTLG
tara:strand:+ start:2562 stop:5258 length:2697 start_codon:yes stop_codon:yes gene_type:complete